MCRHPIGRVKRRIPQPRILLALRLPLSASAIARGSIPSSSVREIILRKPRDLETFQRKDNAGGLGQVETILTLEKIPESSRSLKNN